MHVVVERPAITVGHETGEARIAKSAARISPESKPDGWTMAEVDQESQHIYVTTL
jgi:hypothetical protein